MLRVGLVGCGVIGGGLARAIDSRELPGLELVAICDRNKIKEDELASSLKRMPVTTSIDGVVEKADLIIEAASSNIAGELVQKALNKGKDIMVMSVGGMLDYLHLFTEAREKKCKIYFPSGAIAGLDGIKAAKEACLDSVTLETSKPPQGLKGAPYLLEKNIDLRGIKEKVVIFEGNCQEAVKAFPKNINVAAALSFAGLGMERTKVRIIADPSLKRNVHHIIVKGDFGKLEIMAENVPSPSNPKTSYLAVLSAIATLRGIVDSVKMGS